MRLALYVIGFVACSILVAQNDSTTIKIDVTANNLSEDFSVVSSKSDELMIIIYKFREDSMELATPVFVKNFQFNENRKKITIDWKIVKPYKKFIFFLLEIDSEKTIYQLDPVLRVYFAEIIRCYERRDYLAIEKYLGDDDLLGYGRFSIPSTHHLKGVYKLDKFDYTVTFQE